MAMIPGMLRDNNDKTAITSVINSGEPKEVSDIEKDAEPGLDAACDEMMAAFEAKDGKQLKEALKSFIVMFQDAEGPKEPEAVKSED